jgi:dienelactone hydrolase
MSENEYGILSIVPIDFKNPSDSSRIYLTGLSMGGWGAWNLALLILKCSPLWCLSPDL